MRKELILLLFIVLTSSNINYLCAQIQKDSINQTIEKYIEHGFLIGASSPSLNNNKYSSSLVALSSFEIHYFLNLSSDENFHFQSGLRFRSSSFRYVGIENFEPEVDLQQISQLGYGEIELEKTLINSYESITYKATFRVDEIEATNTVTSDSKIQISNVSQYELRNVAIPLHIVKNFGGKRNQFVFLIGVIPSYNFAFRKDLGDYRQGLVNIRPRQLVLEVDDRYFQVGREIEVIIIERNEMINKFELELSSRIGLINWGFKKKLFGYIHYTKGLIPFSDTRNYMQNVGLLLGFNF